MSEACKATARRSTSRRAAPEAADRFCAARLHDGGGGGALYGTLAPGPALRTIVEAARPRT